MRSVIAAFSLVLIASSSAAQNQSLMLDGDGDRLVIPDHPSLEPANALNLECWFNVTASGPERVLTKGDGIRGTSDRSYDLSIVDHQTVRAWLFFADFSATELNAPIAVSGWHHVALTFDSSEGMAKIFVDGVQVSSSSTAEAGTQQLIGKQLRNSTRPLIVGAQEGFSVWDYDGQLDSLRIWNRARSESEIRCTINESLTAVDSAAHPDLVSSWNFDGDASDSVGSNHGSIIGDTSFVASAGVPMLDLPCTERVGVDLCKGDGGNQAGCTDCPCGNNATLGAIGGCLNSANTSAQLVGTGSPSVSLPAGSLSDLRFQLHGGPPGSFGVLSSGQSAAPINAANPCFGLDSGVRSAQFDGLRCTVQALNRHGGRPIDGTGSVGVSNSPWGGEGAPAAGLANTPMAIAPGQTRFFQVVYRDNPTTVCQRGLNSTQAIRVTFAP